MLVVNRQMADLVWPEGSPLDRCVRIGGVESPCSRVIGVVDNAQRGTSLDLEASTPSTPSAPSLEAFPGWA